MATKVKKFSYGDPAPKDWGEVATILKGSVKPPKAKGPSMHDRMTVIEDLLKKGK